MPRSHGEFTTVSGLHRDKVTGGDLTPLRFYPCLHRRHTRRIWFTLGNHTWGRRNMPNTGWPYKPRAGHKSKVSDGCYASTGTSFQLSSSWSQN